MSTEIRLILPDEREQMVELRDYCFSRPYSGARLQDYQAWTESATNIGAFQEKKLVGQAMILPLGQFFREKPVNMGGISYVGIYPENRSGGIMKRVLQMALEKMYEQGQIISVLGPFSVNFYRKFGWEVMFDSYSYEIDMRDFPDILIEGLPDFRRYSFADVPKAQISTLYHQIAKKHQGWMIRSEQWWRRLELRDADSYFVVVDHGFMRYRKEGTNFIVEDFISADSETEKQLLFYITLHRSNFFKVKGLTSSHNTLNYFLTGIPNQRKVGNQFMGRIVDVLSFIQLMFKAQAPRIYLRVSDHICPWNNDTFLIEKNVINRVLEKEVNEDDIISIDISDLTSLLFGYKSADQLYNLGLFKGKKSNIEKMVQVLEIKPVEIFDHF